MNVYLLAGKFCFFLEFLLLKRLKVVWCRSASADNSMINQYNENNWAVRERLRYIENCAWWKGFVNRQDLTEMFGVSMAQASTDMQRFLDLSPDSLAYNLRLKRYEARSTMECVGIQPRLEEAVALFLAGDVGSLWSGGIVDEAQDGAFGVVLVPTQGAGETVQRRAFLAVVNGHRVRMCYTSRSTGKAEWRSARPHALGHNGFHWYLRAWCERNAGFQDFSLGRISEIEWSREQAPLPQPDLDWEEWVTLRLRANPKLDKANRQTVEFDYGMSKGPLTIKVRKAMQSYLLARLGIGVVGNSASLFERVK